MHLSDNGDKVATVKGNNIDFMDIYYIDSSFLVYPFLISSQLSSIFTCQCFPFLIFTDFENLLIRNIITMVNFRKVTIDL